MNFGEDSIVIHRPADEVLQFVADSSNDPKWHTTVVEVRRTSAGPIGLGSTFEGTYDSHKQTLEAPADPKNFQGVRGIIAEYVPERSVRIHVEFTRPPRGIGARVLGRTFELTFRVEAVPEGTRLYRGGEFHPVPLVWPLLAFYFLPRLPFGRTSSQPRTFTSGRSLYLLGNIKRAIEGPARTTEAR